MAMTALEKGTPLQSGKYTIEKELGHGTFGITYLAKANFITKGNLGQMTFTADVAIKEFFMHDINSRMADGYSVAGSSGYVFTNYRSRFRKEAENLAKLFHPGIVKVLDIFDQNNTTYYVMQYLGGANLDHYIWEKNGLPGDECCRLTLHIGAAIQFMHDAKMLHLDLKPGNIMLDGDLNPVLIDFGLSKQFAADGQPESSTAIGLGTPGYAPLEQQNYNPKISLGLPFGMDVYALGATMYKMLCASTPPDASMIFNDGFPRQTLQQHHVAESLINIVEKAMMPGKHQRYQTVKELLEAINKIYTSEDHETMAEEITEAATFENNQAGYDKTPFIAMTGSKAALSPGEIITSPDGNRYKIIRLLGINSFHFTYLALPIGVPGKRVVIREFFLNKYSCRHEGIIGLIGDFDISDFLSQFRRSGEILKRLKGSPYIEQLHDAFNANGTHYIVVEALAGFSLSDYQKHYVKGPLPEREVFKIAVWVCEALEQMAVHSCLHLDIRPHHIMKTESGYVLINMGLARRQAADVTTSLSSNVGYTPGYSSIEQTMGSGPLSAAADIYSLGATMYALLTAERPRNAFSLLQTGFHKMENRLKAQGVSPKMITIIKKAMSPTIRDRYQSASELKEVLINSCRPYSPDPRTYF